MRPVCLGLEEARKPEQRPLNTSSFPVSLDTCGDASVITGLKLELGACLMTGLWGKTPARRGSEQPTGWTWL